MAQVYGKDGMPKGASLPTNENSNWWSKLNMAYMDQTASVEYSEQDFIDYNKTSKLSLKRQTEKIDTYPGVSPVHMEGTQIKLLPRKKSAKRKVQKQFKIDRKTGTSFMASNTSTI